MQGGQIDRLFMIYKHNSLKERRTDMAAISIDGTPMTALPADADQINYDNTSSGLSATEVQDAIDESYGAFSELCLCVVNGKVCQRVRKEV